VDAKEQFPQLKTRIENYIPEYIVNWAISHLHSIDKKFDFPKGQLLHWELLLMVKLAMLYGGKKYHLKKPSEDQLRTTLNELKNLYSDFPFLKDENPHRFHKLLRCIAHQQFAYQKSLNSWLLARQIQLFRNLSCKFPIASKFEEYTGISLDDFFECAFILYVLLYGISKEESYPKFSNFPFLFTGQELYLQYPQKNILKFLDLLSIDWENRCNILNDPEVTKITQVQLQHLEQTPFVRYPFIRYKNSQYQLISVKVFEQTIYNFVYDILKSKSGNDFSQEFGKSSFERYLELGLDYAKVKYSTEAALKEVLPEKHSLVDFVISEPQCTVLIECKAIEMKPLAKALQLSELLSRELKTSVTKAVEQIYSVASSLLNSNSSIIASQNIFALVVTYRELFLGPGHQVWEELLKDRVQPFLKQNSIDESIIPPENIFYISIECFDYLVNVISNSEHTLHEIFSSAVEKNRSPQQKKFLLDMHIIDDFRIAKNSLPYLDETMLDFAQRVESNLAILRK